MRTNTLNKNAAYAKFDIWTQIGLAITFTTNNYVKHRILHAMRDADAILHAKTG